jgi:hypothetical protein
MSARLGRIVGLASRRKASDTSTCEYSRQSAFQANSRLASSQGTPKDCNGTQLRCFGSKAIPLAFSRFGRARAKHPKSIRHSTCEYSDSRIPGKQSLSKLSGDSQGLQWDAIAMLGSKRLPQDFRGVLTSSGKHPKSIRHKCLRVLRCHPGG